MPYILCLGGCCQPTPAPSSVQLRMRCSRGPCTLHSYVGSLHCSSAKECTQATAVLHPMCDLAIPDTHLCNNMQPKKHRTTNTILSLSLSLSLSPCVSLSLSCIIADTSGKFQPMAKARWPGRDISNVSTTSSLFRTVRPGPNVCMINNFQVAPLQAGHCGRLPEGAWWEGTVVLCSLSLFQCTEAKLGHVCGPEACSLLQAVSPAASVLHCHNLGQSFLYHCFHTGHPHEGSPLANFHLESRTVFIPPNAGFMLRKLVGCYFFHSTQKKLHTFSSFHAFNT